MGKKSSCMRGFISQFVDAAYFFPTITVVLLGIVWILTFNLIHSVYADARRSAIILGHELLATYEIQTLQSLDEIDQSLKMVRYAYETGGDQDILKMLQAKDLLPPSVIFSICIVDQDGQLISSTGPGSSCTFNDYFLDELQQHDAVIINTPPASTESALSFGRRLNKNALAGGAVIITVQPEYFAGSIERPKYGSNGLKGLLDSDGAFQALRVGANKTVGESVEVNLSVPNGWANGTILNYWDGIQRYTFIRPLSGYPLKAVVGLAEHDQLAIARKRAETYLTRATAGSLFLVLIFAALTRESRLLSQSHEKAAQVEYMAYHDPLTGLANRGLFTKLLQQELALAKRDGRSFSLFFLDLDRFKNINDTFGHDAGDQLLIKVTERLVQCLRSSDVIARIGGDEFIILLPQHKGDSSAKVIAEKIISAVAEPFSIHGQDINITISIGISMYPAHGQDEYTLIKNADIAMYQAKTHGRSNYQFYSSNLRPKQPS